jgi:hypothetical protein
MATIASSWAILSRSLVPSGIGLSFFHPSSPFRLPPMQCQFSSNNRSPDVSSDSAWTVSPDDQLAERQGRSAVPGEHRDNRNGRFLTATMMRQISLGGVLGLAAGLGLRIFSRSLALVLGVGLVVVEVISFNISYM